MEKENNHVLFAKNSYEDRTCRNSEYSTTCRIVVLRLCLLFLCQKIKREGTDMYYLYVPTETLEIPVTAERLLRSIGATGRLTGFTYTVFMIEQIVSGQGSVRLITKILYPETAKHFGVSPHAVERALRTLINSCWVYGDREMLSNVAGRTLTRAPSNSDFLDMLAAYIKNKN